MDCTYNLVKTTSKYIVITNFKLMPFIFEESRPLELMPNWDWTSRLSLQDYCTVARYSLICQKLARFDYQLCIHIHWKLNKSFCVCNLNVRYLSRLVYCNIILRISEHQYIYSLLAVYIYVHFCFFRLTSDLSRKIYNNNWKRSLHGVSSPLYIFFSLWSIRYNINC